MDNSVVVLTQALIAAPTTLTVALMDTPVTFQKDSASKEPLPWYSPLFPSLNPRLLALPELALPVKLVVILEMANSVAALTQALTVALTTLIVALMDTPAIFPRDSA